MNTSFSFTPRWKELLDCCTPWGNFTSEMTMGILHVYFPNEAKWKEAAPEQLRDKWRDITRELEDWCMKQTIPVSFVYDAWIEFSGTN